MANTTPSTSLRGLTEADAQTRLKSEEYNELPRAERRTPLRIISEVLREPMLALLLGGGAIYLVIGDLQDALILLAFATLSVVITVVLAEGDRVPADAVLVESHDLQTDESLLTGESVPVRKVAGSEDIPPIPRRPGGNDLPNVFSGSLVVRGTGVGEVLAIGNLSEIGKTRCAYQGRGRDGGDRSGETQDVGHSRNVSDGTAQLMPC